MADTPPPAPSNPFSDAWFLIIAIGVLLLLGIVSGTISKQSVHKIFLAPPYDPTTSDALKQVIEESGYATTTQVQRATTTNQQ